MSIRRWLPFILLNIFVTTVTALIILSIWDRNASSGEEGTLLPEPTLAIATAVENAGIPDNLPPTAEIPTPQPTQDYPAHTVQAGETLGTISQKYDVAVSDIMIMNDIENENFIQLGQRLIIPVGGLPSPTPQPTSTPQPTPTQGPVLPTNTPNFTSGEAEIGIAEVIGIGILSDEAVLIVNSGSQALGLAGWTLRDTQGHVYTFGQWTLFGEGAGIRVHTEAGEDQPTDLYWGLEQAIWQTGETIILRDVDGEVRSQYLIGSP